VTKGCCIQWLWKHIDSSSIITRRVGSPLKFIRQYGGTQTKQYNNLFSPRPVCSHLFAFTSDPVSHCNVPLHSSFHISLIIISSFEPPRSLSQYLFIPVQSSSIEVHFWQGDCFPLFYQFLQYFHISFLILYTSISSPISNCYLFLLMTCLFLNIFTTTVSHTRCCSLIDILIHITSH
jgi:hypothetical protein